MCSSGRGLYGQAGLIWKEMKLESCLGDDLLCRYCRRAGRLLPGEEGSRQYYYGLARQSG